MFLRKGVALAGVGIVAGVVVSASTASMMASLLYGVRPHDPAVLLIVPLLLLAVAALASLSPSTPRDESETDDCLARELAIVTVTTVGYEDISPQTVIGRILASLLVMVGYGIIAVPTGIVTFEFARASAAGRSRVCSACGDAIFCKRCGAQL